MPSAAIELLHQRVDAFLQHRSTFLSLSGAPAVLGQLLVCQREREMIGNPRRQLDVVVAVRRRSIRCERDRTDQRVRPGF
jgi:hypothetical protein